MRIENAVGAEVLERMLSAYGFSMQKELAEHLGIAKSNVAGWVQRGQVPGNAIVQCALDTGADLSWLITGQIENASSSHLLQSNIKGKALYEEVMANGGKPVLRRILDAYGFTMQKQLCDLLNISSATVSTWIRRNYFPGDIVVACALDTGTPLRWLALGETEALHDYAKQANNLAIPHKRLASGKLQDNQSWIIDLSFLPANILKPIFITTNNKAWIIDANLIEISNGRWLLGIDKKYDIYDIAILPNNKISATSNGFNFTCKLDEFEIVGKVLLTINYSC